MGFWNWLAKYAEQRASLATADKGSWLYNALVGGAASSGVTVNQSTALQYSALWAAVRVISETVASLPFQVHRETEEGKDKATSHPVYDLLQSQPNPSMTAIVFREIMTGHLLTWGNAYCRITRNNAGQVQALFPMLPESVSVFAKGNRLFYLHKIDGKEFQLSSADVLHLVGFGYDGCKGYSPIAYQKNSIGMGIAAEQYGAEFFGNGAVFSGAIKHPATLSTDAHDRLAKSIKDKKKHSTLILEEGMDFKEMSIPPEDAQFIETRKFQATDIARLYRLPPHKIQILDNATFSNIEHQSIEFVTDAIRPYLIRWEQEGNRKLFTRSERQSLFLKHNIEGILRGDTKSRYDSYAIGRNWGWLSVNDIRELEDMNRVEGGDVYLQPLNMQDVANPDAPAASPEQEEPVHVFKFPVDKARSIHKQPIFSLCDRLVNQEVKAIINTMEDSDCTRWNKFIEKQEQRIKETLYPAVFAYSASFGGTPNGNVSEFLNRFSSQVLEEASAVRASGTIDADVIRETKPYIMTDRILMQMEMTQ